MDYVSITMERQEARKLYEQYRGALHFGGAIDREIARTYRLMAQGKVIVRALDSIARAGLNEDGLPKLAIMRADKPECWLEMTDRGSATLGPVRWTRHDAAADVRFSFSNGTFSPPETVFPLVWRGNGARVSSVEKKAIVPIIPAHLRPKAHLSNYHILWEADWESVPTDPILLRRLGKGDLWVVLAAWDLTDVERAALQARV